jgi:hypothetical protein
MSPLAYILARIFMPLVCEIGSEVEEAYKKKRKEDPPKPKPIQQPSRYTLWGWCWRGYLLWCVVVIIVKLNSN